MGAPKYSLCLALFALAILPLCSAQRAIILVRHAEKIDDNLNGKDVPLSKAGKDRAQLLAEMLKDSGITVIYATDTVRTRDTALPTARKLGLKIRNLEQHDPEGAVRRMQHENANDVVLIVGHADTLPGLLEALGYRREIKIPNADYTNFFVVIPREGKAPSIIRVGYGEDEDEHDARRKNPPAPRRKSAMPAPGQP
ncbi:MAG: histidine phosphatase family protein [Acidobacteriota bacterium]|nr:histidine phosphatase family protein [Acidobacteriota bacterium]